MKKIMFNDALGLTQAVLEGRKTQTRRVATYEDIKCPNIGWALEGKGKGKRVLCKGEQIVAMSAYAKGEVVAIAQSYKDIDVEYEQKGYLRLSDRFAISRIGGGAGWKNKMFVEAGRMPHHIRITGIRVEHLQDISVEDCYTEGISYHGTRTDGLNFTYDNSILFATAKEAYQALIDKLDKKMWERNPFVFVYEFELMD